MKPELEDRSIRGEIREIKEQGIVTAYLTKWGTVDDYNTTFRRGSFKRTFAERGTKIKLMYNHETLAGKVIETGENDVGPFAVCQFNLDTRAGRETFAHIKNGDLDAFSFRFLRLQSNQLPDGVTEITEVKVVECGPVDFPANEQAAIVDFRSTSFDDTYKNIEVSKRGYELVRALFDTLEEILYSGGEELSSLADAAIAEFHRYYVEWASELDAASADEARKTFPGNQLKCEMRNHDPDELAKTTALTDDEIKLLRKGSILPMSGTSRTKLDSLPDALRKAHHARRCEAVSTLCDELRFAGFSRAESKRFSSLLNLNDAREPESDIVTLINNTVKNWKL